LYKINLEKEKVFSLPAPLYRMHYKTLVAELTEGTPVKEYSIDDDVLHPNTKSRGCGGIDGGVYPSYDNTYDGQIIKTFPDGTVWRLNPYVRFFRAGVYFKLSSGFEIWRYPSSSHHTGGQIVRNISNSGLSIEMFIRGPEGWWKPRPCNSVGTISYGYHYSQGTYGNYNKFVYKGTRNLNGYYFFVQGRAKYADGTFTIASPYGGRNINSPY
jgi:hypothetical protein